MHGGVFYSCVAGESVGPTVHQESVVIEEIKEVELRSRRAQLFMTEIMIELVSSQAPSRLPVKTLRRLLPKMRKVRVFAWKGIWKNIISQYSSTFTINQPPRRRSVRSQSVLSFMVHSRLQRKAVIVFTIVKIFSFISPNS